MATKALFKQNFLETKQPTQMTKALKNAPRSGQEL